MLSRHDTLTDEEDPNNVIGKVEILDILGTLGVDTDQQKLIEIRVIMTNPLCYLLWCVCSTGGHCLIWKGGRYGHSN